MISNLSFNEIVKWILSHKSGLVFCCTLNELMMADEDKDFKKKLESADILTPDGMPLVWCLWKKYGKGERVYGPEILKKIINLQSTNFNKKNQMIFVGDEKNKKYFEKFGDYIVMPMKEKFKKNDYDKLEKQINKSKAGIVWLGLGAKKQVEAGYELKQRGAKKVIITVGAAFDFLSGNKRQAPKWMRNIGGEWIYRLILEPRRLFKRYLKIILFLIRKIIIGR